MHSLALSALALGLFLLYLQRDKFVISIRLKWVLLALVVLLIGIHMYISNKGTDLIRQFEGFRAHAYQDAVGVWTIGYGHTKGVTPNMVISSAEGEQMLKDELQEYENYVNDMVTCDLNQNQFDALVSWVYNLGPANLQASTLLKVLNAGDYAGVPAQIMRWNKAGGKVLEGLTRRRQAEADLFAN